MVVGMLIISQDFGYFILGFVFGLVFGFFVLNVVFMLIIIVFVSSVLVLGYVVLINLRLFGVLDIGLISNFLIKVSQQSLGIQDQFVVLLLSLGMFLQLGILQIFFIVVMIVVFSICVFFFIQIMGIIVVFFFGEVGEYYQFQYVNQFFVSKIGFFFFQRDFDFVLGIQGFNFI